MASTRIFGGVTLYVPGAYDQKNVILTGSAPSIAVGKVAIIGESDKGRPGSVEILQFSPEALSDLISEYGSGPLVDAARALVIPSNDNRITNGASSIYVYKTNPSTKASLALDTTWGQVDSIEYGQEANLISVLLEKSNAVDAQAVSSTPFNSTTATAVNSTFSIRVDGGAIATWTAPAGVDTRAELQTELDNAANWAPGLPSGITFLVGGASDIAATLTISRNLDANDHRLGASRLFELMDGTSTPLAAMNISTGLKLPSSEEKMRLVVARTSDNSLEDSDDLAGDIGGQIFLEIGYLGTTATLTISSTALTTTVVGGTGGNLSLTLANFRTLTDVATYINSQSGYSALIPAEVNASLSPSVLDRVSSLGIASSTAGVKPGKIKADAYSMFDYVRRNSALVSIPNTGSRKGLPDPIPATFLANGSRGASANSNFLAGLDSLESIEDVDLIVPLVSQDASDDLAEQEGYTDNSSTYTVAAIHLATKNHCKKMSATKARKERACYLGMRGTISEVTSQSLSLNSEFASLVAQDVSILGTDGNLFWGQPHLAAALCAGMQAGGDIGEPTTKKLINASAIRHVKKQGLTPTLTEAINPKTKLDVLIEKGVLPLNNPSSGGVEIVVQNATYSRDSNFVFNRPSVFSAMNYIAKVMRKSLEDKFVGTKQKTSTKDAIKAEVVALMADFLRSDIIVGDDSNGGVGYKSLSLRIDGNAVYIDITVTPVQGIDFILSNINIDNIRIAA